MTLPRPHTAAEQVEFLRYTLPERWSTLERFPVDGAAADLLLRAMMAAGHDDVPTARAAIARDRAERVAALVADATVAAALRRLPFGAGDKVVAVGDSITADRSGWFELLAAALDGLGEPHATTVNLAVSGSTTADAIERFDLLEAARPTHVLLMLGTNDARGHGRVVRRPMVSAAETARNLAVLGELVTDELGAELVVMTPPSCDAERVGAFFADLPLGWLPADVDAVADAVRRFPAPVIDVHAFTRRHGDASTYADDGVHLSPRGQQQLAAFVVRELADVVSDVRCRAGRSAGTGTAR